MNIFNFSFDCTSLSKYFDHNSWRFHMHRLAENCQIGHKYISTTVLYEDNVVSVWSFLSSKWDGFLFYMCECVKCMRACRCECDEVSGWKRCELHSHQCSVVIFKASVMVVFIFWHIYLTLFVYSVSIWVYDIMWFLSPSIAM